MSPAADPPGSADPRILVVGDTPAAAALAGTLARSGADLTLLSRRTRSFPEELVLVHPIGLAVLDQLGVGNRIRSVGEPLSELRAVEGGETLTATVPADADRTLIVDRGVLHRSLGTLVPESARRDAVVAAIEDREDCARVTFEDGQRARFDAVVGADGPTSAIRATTGSFGSRGTGLHEWSFVVDRDDGDRHLLREFWADEGFAAAVTTADATAVRIVVPSDAVGAPHHEATLRTASAGIADPVVDLLDRLEDRSPQYRRVGVCPDGAPLHSGRVALCGTAARPGGLTTGLEPTLGLADATTLGELLVGTDDPRSALETYGARRSRGSTGIPALGKIGTDAAYAPADAEGPVAAVRTLRAVALGHLLDNGTGRLLTG